MKNFQLVRTEDISGVSGTGIVADGVIFPDGTCSLRWRTAGGSTAIYDSIEKLEKIHGHDGRTKVVQVGLTAELEPSELVLDRPDWRERYENLNPSPEVYPIEQSAKLRAFSKILCYVEWANEGEKRDRNRHWYIICRPDFSSNLRLCTDFWCESGFNKFMDLYEEQDAENMLKDDEIREALNVVFNVK